MAALTAAQMGQVETVFKEGNVPRYVWEPIMKQESGGNPGSNATKGEDSRGLFQINMAVHSQKYAGLDLYDPVVNAKIALRDFIGPAYAKAVSLGIKAPNEQASYVWKNGIRPNWDLALRNGKVAALEKDASMTALSGTSTASKSWWQSWLDSHKPDSLIIVDETTGETTKDGLPYTPTPGELSGGGGLIGAITGVRDVSMGTAVWVILGLILFIVGLYVAFNPIAGISGVLKGVMKNVKG